MWVVWGFYFLSSRRMPRPAVAEEIWVQKERKEIKMLLKTPGKSCTEQPTGILQPANPRLCCTILCRAWGSNTLGRLIKYVCILYALEVLTQLISESSIPFKYTILRNESSSSQCTTHSWKAEAETLFGHCMAQRAWDQWGWEAFWTMTHVMVHHASWNPQGWLCFCDCKRKSSPSLACTCFISHSAYHL